MKTMVEALNFSDQILTQIHHFISRVKVFELSDFDRANFNVYLFSFCCKFFAALSFLKKIWVEE